MKTRKPIPKMVHVLVLAACISGLAALMLGLDSLLALVLMLALAAAVGLTFKQPISRLTRGGVAEITRFMRAWLQINRNPALPVHPISRTQTKSGAAPVPSMPAFLMWIFFGAMVCSAGLALLFVFELLPIALLFTGVAVGIGLEGRALGLEVLRPLRRLKDRLAWDEVPLEAVPRRRIVLELLVIMTMTLIVTQRFYTVPPDRFYSGGEAEWITNSAYTAWMYLHEQGRIPRWQPWLEMGEPLIDNPVGFVLNPFSSGPMLLLGPSPGLPIGVVVGVLLAGIGGWFLGWALGLSTAARILLGLLLVGKGNMQAMFNTGYYQLAAQQAYFPWIVGGLLALIRLPGKRWPIVLPALAFTLLWFSGNVWYTLPMLMTGGVLALVYGISGKGRRIDGPMVRRLALVAMLTGGLSAATLLPLAVNWNRLDRHLPEIHAGRVVALWRSVIPFYFNPDMWQSFVAHDPTQLDTRKASEEFYMDGQAATYYSYILPPWYAALLIVFPLYGTRKPVSRRFWWVAWGLLILCTLWGAGGQPLWLWLYQTFPVLRGWRFVGRALGIGSFCIAALAAMRLDGLLHTITASDWRAAGMRAWLARALPVVLGGGLLIASAAAAGNVLVQWNTPPANNILKSATLDDPCIRWLRAQHPDEPLAVWRSGYSTMNTYLSNQVRTARIQADFEMSPAPYTIGRGDLTQSMPEYAMPVSADDQRYLTLSESYIVVPESPALDLTGGPCLYRKTNALSYAYTVPLVVVKAALPEQREGTLQDRKTILLPPSATVPETNFIRNVDNLALVVMGRPGPQVLTVQERAFPGWRVEIDGQPAKLESVGGQIGVLLPEDNQRHFVYFEYRPALLYLGGMITLLTAAFCTAYLLRADRVLRLLVARLLRIMRRRELIAGGNPDR